MRRARAGRWSKTVGGSSKTPLGGCAGVAIILQTVFLLRHGRQATPEDLALRAPNRSRLRSDRRAGGLPARPRRPGAVSVHPWRAADDVPRPAVDHAAIRRFRHGGGDE